MILNAFSKTYKQKTVLNFPGFTFQEGKIYAVIGANGSGKSTFARIAAGCLAADKNTPVCHGPLFSVGYLPQRPFSFRMSLYQNLMLNGSGNKTADALRANELMQSLELSSLSCAKAVRLSGGETAKMALARLFMKKYDLLILDEPTAAMDVNATLRSEALIQKYCSTSHAVVILITHSLKQALRLSDETLFFKEGQLLEYGPSSQVLTNPTQSATREFIEFYGI